jgi:hypothetical protein
MAPNLTRNGSKGTHLGTRNGTMNHMGTKASHHDPADILAGVDFKNTVITEVDCGPIIDRQAERGLFSKAKELAARLSRMSSHQPTNAGHMRSQHAAVGEEIEMHGPGESNEIIISHAVWRTVEEKPDAKVDHEENNSEGSK